MNDADKAIYSGVAQKGITNVSILFDVDNSNPVEGVVPDYMHGVLLGTTKKVIGNFELRAQIQTLRHQCHSQPMSKWSMDEHYGMCSRYHLCILNICL